MPNAYSTMTLFKAWVAVPVEWAGIAIGGQEDEHPTMGLSGCHCLPDLPTEENQRRRRRAEVPSLTVAARTAPPRTKDYSCASWWGENGRRWFEGWCSTMTSWGLSWGGLGSSAPLLSFCVLRFLFFCWGIKLAVCAFDCQSVHVAAFTIHLSVSFRMS